MRTGRSAVKPRSTCSLDFEEAEHELAASTQTGSAEDYFEKEWVRTLFALAVERLRAQCQQAGKTTQFAVFERYDLGDEELGRLTPLWPKSSASLRLT